MPTPCPICGDPADGDEYCHACAGLLRWVRAYFADEPNHSITPTTRFDEMRVDSLDYMECLIEAEEKLDIAIYDHLAERIETVGEFVRSLKTAGARWPDSLDLKMRPRHWWQPYCWDVVPHGAGSESPE